jgi:hypothetical protein
MKKMFNYYIRLLKFDRRCTIKNITAMRNILSERGIFQLFSCIRESGNTGQDVTFLIGIFHCSGLQEGCIFIGNFPDFFTQQVTEGCFKFWRVWCDEN